MWPKNKHARPDLSTVFFRAIKSDNGSVGTRYGLGSPFFVNVRPYYFSLRVASLVDALFSNCKYWVLVALYFKSVTCHF